MRPLFRYLYRCGNCGSTWWGTGGNCPSCGSGDVHTRNLLRLLRLIAVIAVLTIGMYASVQAEQADYCDEHPEAPECEDIEDWPIIIGPGPCHSDTPWGCYEFQVWMPLVGGGS